MKWFAYKGFLCVLKTWNLENHSLGFALHFKLRDRNAWRIQIVRFAQGRLCCDACKVPVVQPDHCSSELIGLHRKTTSFTRVCGSKSREETRSCCKCRNRSLSVLLYTLIPLFLLFHCFVKFTYKEKKIKRLNKEIHHLGNSFAINYHMIMTNKQYGVWHASR